MRKISIDNGATYMTADEAIPRITEYRIWDAVAAAMDDDVREKVHAALAPCTEAEFLTEYLRHAPDHLVIG